jgi:hypothetical protein
MLDPNARGDSPKPRHLALRPLDERDRVGPDVVGEQLGILLRGEVGYPVQVEV